MKTAWQLQDAKNRFSEVVELAIHQGPQWVTRRGKDAVVVVAAGDYQKIHHPKNSLTEFFRKSPLRDIKLDLKRSRDTGRKVEL